jgi:hypothetical protein
MQGSDSSSKLEKMILQRKSIFFHVNINNIGCIIDNLKFVYYSVIATENLLSCAIAQLKKMECSTHNDGLLSYFIDHLEEEREHSKWLAEDLGTHGVNLDSYDENAMAMIGSQYYMIYHKHPSCLLGYMAVVEGTPTPIQEIEKLERIYGKKLFRFARFHSIKDEEHKIELFNHIDNTPHYLMDDIFLSTDITLNHMSNAAKHWI